MAKHFSEFSYGSLLGRQKTTRQNAHRFAHQPLAGLASENAAAVYPATQRLALILRQVEQSLFFAAGSGALALALQQALGVDTSGGEGLAVLRTWQNREAPRGQWAIPAIELVEAAVLPAQRGAYVAESNVILLNRQWLATATNAEVMAVLIEEYGHRLDQVFTPTDTPGDKGARFKDLVLGTPAAPGDYDDDQFELVLNGQTYLAEAATLTGSGTITGFNAENDSLTGSTGNDSISGLGGNDTLRGGDGNDTLRGGAGNDSIDGGAGFDILDLSDATDRLTFTLRNNSSTPGTVSGVGIDIDTYTFIEGVISGSGDDSITGSIGADLLAGGAGNDTLLGGAGNDTLRGGGGNDSIDGGAGTLDILDLSDATGAINFLNNNPSVGGRVIDVGIGTDTFINIEGVITGAGNDTLVGSSNADWLRAGNGNNLLRQSPVNANNTTGVDTLEGGSGNDEYQLTQNNAPVIRDSGGDDILFYMPVGTASSSFGYNSTIQQGIERISLDPNSRVSGTNLTGDGGSNYLIGSLGNDILSGGGGNDTISGGGGSDTINGGSGADTILITQPKPTLLSNAPVAMDMNGDGTITYVGRNLTKAKFNFSRDDDEKYDQSTEITAWVANGDGFLAFDKDTNGIINKTSELAFTCYDEDAKTDLDALRRYFDRDEFGRKDGFLDANDIYFEKFGVWVDQNLPGKLGDGICQPGEFKSLKELKITRIKLTVWGGSIKPFTVAEADNDVTVFGRTQFTINGVQRRAEDVRTGHQSSRHGHNCKHSGLLRQ